MKLITKIALMAITISGFYYTYKVSLPTEIIDVHKYTILVKNFPLTEKNKIKWWQDNEHYLKEKYGIPQPYADGSFTLRIMDIGDRYQLEEPKKDWLFPSRDTSHLLCFSDMKEKANCIEKKLFMRIHKDEEGHFSFYP